MMNLIYAIPENIGWIIVGATGVLVLEMYCLLIKTVIDMVRNWRTDNEEED